MTMVMSLATRTCRERPRGLGVVSEEGLTIQSLFEQQRQSQQHNITKEKVRGVEDSEDRCACQAQFQNTFMVS